jgi:hypothetical protein
MQLEKLCAALGASALLCMGAASFATFEVDTAEVVNIVGGAGVTATVQYGQTTISTNSFAPPVKVTPYIGGDWTPVATAP